MQKNFKNSISAFEELNINTLEFMSRVRLVPQSYHTYINIIDAQINEWNLTWLTQFLRNRLNQPLKLNRLHWFDLNRVNVV